MVIPPFSPEKKTYGMLLFVQLLHSCLLHRGKSATCYRYSQALTYSILLSTIRLRRMVPLSLQRGKYVISFCFPLFKQSGINYPPTSSVPLSFKKGASFLMLSFNQLLHACPLQEENILLHSCNLQGLHHPEPRMA